MSNSVYYLPGRGGSLNEGLGAALTQSDLLVSGRELKGAFKAARFSEQVSLIAEDLLYAYWSPDSKLIANSYGAYLFLHAQAELPPFPGAVLLLSPIVGASGIQENMIGFIPPRSKRLFELAESGGYPAPTNCEIHVGSEDWQADAMKVRALGSLLKIPVHIAAESGHVLDEPYVRHVLSEWLAKPVRPEIRRPTKTYPVRL